VTRAHARSGRTVSRSSSVLDLGCIEVLRLTGIRHEELLELSHLSVRQYRRPNGEVVALLLVTPSKSDRER
jgi:hypothetical protein